MAREDLSDRSRATARPRRAESDRLLAFLAGLATEMSAVLDLHVLLQHIIRAVHDSIGFESCAVALLETGGGEDMLVVKAGSGLRAGATGLRFARGRGLIWEVMQRQTPLIVPDLHADARVLRKDPGVRSGIYAPLVCRTRSSGVLSAYRAEVDAFCEPDLHLLTVVARYIASAVEVSQLHDALKNAAATDSLTGIANRRTFMERFQQEVARSERTRRPVTIVLVDLDGFKQINDTCGHGAGDEVLVAVGRALSADRRACDLAARYGGDEFVLLLPETDEAGARVVIDHAVAAGIPLPDSVRPHGGLDVSWGSATWPADGTTVDQLLLAADLRLYAMKAQHGRLPDPAHHGHSRAVGR